MNPADGEAQKIDPCAVVGEVLGQPANEMRNPVNADYCCPFMNSICTKRSQRIGGAFPVCSVFKSGKPCIENLVAVCPKRFLAIELQEDVLAHCWVGGGLVNPRMVSEVKMSNLGMVDFVLADFNEDLTLVRSFVSIELQAIDITGSYEPAYSALVHNQFLDKKPTYGFNWANVRKRYITQLINKGFFHHHWKTRIISVLQDHVFERIQKDLCFEEIAVSRSDIVFLVYSFVHNDMDGGFTLNLSKVVGTSHNSLMMRVLYQHTPPREDFCKRIIERAT